MDDPINLIQRAKLDNVSLAIALDEIKTELGWTDAEAIAALEWVALPTIRPIVGVREFIESPYYMGTLKDDGTNTIYPEVMRELVEMNSGEYDEVVLTGGIGSAKTTCALYSTAYQLYILSCYSDPHDLFGLDPSSEIVFIFQSINAKAAMTVDYLRFRAMIEKSPYFRDYFPFDRNLTSELVFPKRIYVRPVSSLDTAAIGQNVFGGVLDEVNFMAVIQNSKTTIDGGVYDQAAALYDSISKRRKSRFGYAGTLPGLLCLVSSKRYPGQFTDRKTEEAQEQIARTGKSKIYVYDKRTWEIKPPEYFTGKWFKIFVGDAARRPRVLAPGEEKGFNEYDLSLVMDIPTDYENDFAHGNIMTALRDVAGVSTIALHPFIPDREAVLKCVRKDKLIFLRETVDFKEVKLQIDSSQLFKPEIERFVHCDLALTGDSAGMAIGCVTDFKPMARGEGTVEVLPNIYIDGLLEIKPPRGGEILLYKVREVIYTLKKMGMNIKWVSFDQFQSRDSMQLLKQAGYQVGYQSMDINTMPYDFLKNALYDGRINMPNHAKCKMELFSLERDVKRNKIDHPAYFCFTGETRVALANGTNPTFKELASLYKPDDVFYIYTMTTQGVAIAPARNSRITKTSDRLVEVELDNFQIIRCTPEHLFMTLQGDWVQAQNLTPDIFIMPLYRSICQSGGWVRYERVWCPVREERILTHHLAAGSPPEGHILHHRDENKRNNDPRNLELMSRPDHSEHHGTTNWGKKREAMKSGFDKHFANDAAREASRERINKTWAEGKFGPPALPCAVEGCDDKSKAKGMCDKHYQQVKRKEKSAMRGLSKNHRVLSIKMIEAAEPVYDITVPGTENFALSAGVFVHNSKDVSDALAGVVFGLTMRRETWAKHGVSLNAIPQSILQAIAKKKAEKEVAVGA